MPFPGNNVNHMLMWKKANVDSFHYCSKATLLHIEQNNEKEEIAYDKYSI